MRHLDMKKLAETVVCKRKEMKISQGTLSECIGINRSLISRLESGDYIPLDQFLALSAALGVETGDIGGGTPENLLDYIRTLQEELVRAGVLPEDYDFEGHREFVAMQPSDVPVTYADSRGLEDDYGFRPTIGIREGLRKFAEWYAGYYQCGISG